MSFLTESEVFPWVEESLEARILASLDPLADLQHEKRCLHHLERLPPDFQRRRASDFNVLKHTFAVKNLTSEFHFPGNAVEVGAPQRTVQVGHVLGVKEVLYGGELVKSDVSVGRRAVMQAENGFKPPIAQSHE